MHVSVSLYFLCSSISFLSFSFLFLNYNFIHFLRKLSCTRAFFIPSWIVGNHHFLFHLLDLPNVHRFGVSCAWLFVLRGLFPQPLKPWVSSQALQSSIAAFRTFFFFGLFSVFSFMILTIIIFVIASCSLESQISVSVPSPLGFNFLLLPLSPKVHWCRSLRIYLNFFNACCLWPFEILIFLWNSRYFPSCQLTWTFILNTLLRSAKTTWWI